MKTLEMVLKRETFSFEYFKKNFCIHLVRYLKFWKLLYYLFDEPAGLTYNSSVLSVTILF